MDKNYNLKLIDKLLSLMEVCSQNKNIVFRSLSLSSLLGVIAVKKKKAWELNYPTPCLKWGHNLMISSSRIIWSNYTSLSVLVWGSMYGCVCAWMYFLMVSLFIETLLRLRSVHNESGTWYLLKLMMPSHVQRVVNFTMFINIIQMLSQSIQWLDDWVFSVVREW